MMSSFEYASGNRTPPPPYRQQQPQHMQPQYYQNPRQPSFSSPSSTHRPQYAQPPTSFSNSSSSPSSEAGRMKTDQVVVEFLYKVAELILQSRVHFQSYGDHRRGNRRARFNLDIEEVPFVRETMFPWKEDVHLPLTIDIYWDMDGQRVLMERWEVVYALGNSHNGSRDNSLGTNRDVIQQLKEVVKKIAVLLRALFAFMRQLPAHQIFSQSYPSNLGYKIYSSSSTRTRSLEFDSNIATSRYSFVPIQTPFGFLKVATMYRQNYDQFQEQHATPAPIFKDDFIIQDYVPASPELQAASNADKISPMEAKHRRSLDSEERQSRGNEDQDLSYERRRRSSPSTIYEDEVSSPKRTQSISQPVAIPQVRSPTVYNDTGSSPHQVTKVEQHAHSYADPNQLGAMTMNPNVTAAPYGYGNVTIERGNTPPSATWQSSSGGTGGSPASVPDELTSPHHHPLATPPRHPRSLSTLKNSRTFMSSSATKKTGHDLHQPRGQSLENFTLDGGSHPPMLSSPSPIQALPHSLGARAHTFHHGSRRKNSFAGAVATENRDDPLQITDLATGVSPHMTPPFTYTNSPGKPFAPSLSGTTPVGNQKPPSSTAVGMPTFNASPPFQANPSELLSTSPGYTYSKNYLFKGPSSAPTFVTTGQFHPGRNGNPVSIAGKTGGLAISSGSSSSSDAIVHATKPRTFSTEFNDSGMGIWGISPDTPDSFALASSNGRVSREGRRFLSSSGDDAAEEGSSLQWEGDSSDLLLPFAIGDVDLLSNATTMTTTGSESERPSFVGSNTSDARSSKDASWDTASVGNFLHQLKHAPRLQIFTTNPDSDGRGRPISSHEPTSTDPNDLLSAPASLFDDELESFRNLRDELAQHL